MTIFLSHIFFNERLTLKTKPGNNFLFFPYFQTIPYFSAISLDSSFDFALKGVPFKVPI